MLSIGDFAQSTGLTVKALRHYDETGLLVPAHVDPHSRRRAYRDHQLRDGVLVKALRAADVPTATIRRVLDGPDGLDGELAAFREELAATRAAQDAALDAAQVLITALARSAPVHERTAAAQHWAGVALPEEPDDPVTKGGTADGGTAVDTVVDTGPEPDGDVLFGMLHRALVEAGNPPTGAPWTTFRTDDTGVVETVVAWPVDRAATGLAVAGQQVRCGTLPARQELVARWEHDGDDLTPHGLPHPAFVALLAALTRRAEDGHQDGSMARDSALRQIPLLGADGPVGIELAFAVS